jgi:hypothetical protein
MIKNERCGEHSLLEHCKRIPWIVIGIRLNRLSRIWYGKKWLFLLYIANSAVVGYYPRAHCSEYLGDNYLINKFLIGRQSIEANARPQYRPT